jgi:hypothetical protein
LPVTGEEEVDIVAAVVDDGSITSPGTFLAVGRSSWESLLRSMLIMATGRGRGVGGCAREHGEQKKKRGTGGETLLAALGRKRTGTLGFLVGGASVVIL